MILDSWGRPTVNVTLGGTRVHALLDSGAAISFSKHVVPGSETIRITGVTGHSIEAPIVRGVEMQIGVEKWKCDVVCQDQNIIGADVCVEQRLIVDLANLKLWKMSGDERLDVQWHPPMELVTATVKPVGVVHLNDGWDPCWQSVMQEYQDIMAKHKLDCGRMDTMILLEGSDPPPQKQYPVPKEAVKPITEVIQQLEAQGQIKRGASVCSSPVWPVLKPDGSYRLTIDYRVLNKHAKSMAPIVAAYPEMIAKLTPDMIIFTVIDISNSYWNLPLDPRCQYKTAFSWETVQYFWTVLPQGYKDSAAIFNMHMREIINKFSKPDRVISYVDDILIGSPSLDEHMNDVKEMLQLLREAGLKINPKKIQLGQDQVQFLGVTVGQSGRTINQQRVELISKMPLPTDERSLRQFLGMTGFCREFVPHYAAVTECLYDLLKQEKWKWTLEHTEAIKTLKELLGNAPALASPDPNKEFRLYPHVGPTTLSVVLTQEYFGKQRPIAYASRLLSTVEQKYPLCTRMVLCCYWAINKFRYLTGTQKVVIASHHTPIVMLANGRWKETDVNCKRLARWTTALLTENIQGLMLKEPNILVGGLTIAGEPHECVVQGRSLQHEVFSSFHQQFDSETECWYIDGSSYYKDGCRMAGFAGICIKNGEVKRSVSYSCRSYSAQFVEIAALLQVLVEVKDEGRVNIVSDSDLVCKGTVIYLPWWNVMGFKGTDGSEIKYASLWKLVEEKAQLFSKINVRKVQAHRKRTTEHHWNNAVDKLAKEAAASAPEWPLLESVVSIPAFAVTRAQAKENDQRAIELGKLQDQDDQLGQIKKDCAAGPIDFEGQKVYLRDGLLVTDKNGFPLWVAPKGVRKDILTWIHGSAVGGHPKLPLALERLEHVAWWPGSKEQMQDHILSCLECARHDPANRKRRGALMRQAPMGPWERIQIDYTGELPNTAHQNKYLLVVVDSFSHWVEAFPTKNCTATTTARILVKEIFSRWGIPTVVDSDNGPGFVGNVVQETCKLLGINQKFHIFYHPESAGQVERMNRTIKNSLRKIVNENGTDWDEKLPFVLATIRSRVCRSTGFAPYEALLGRSMKTWEHLINPVPAALDTAILSESWVENFKDHILTTHKAVCATDECTHKKSQKWFNAKGDTTEHQIGERVMLQDFSTFHPFPKAKWKGPYTILDKIGPSVYLLDVGGNVSRWSHACQIKAFKGKNDLISEDVI